MSKITSIETIANVDGIDAQIAYADGSEVAIIIPHERFRKWSFRAGYWSEKGYYHFLENGLIERIMRQYFKDYPVLSPGDEEESEEPDETDWSPTVPGGRAPADTRAY